MRRVLAAAAVSVLALLAVPVGGAAQAAPTGGVETATVLLTGTGKVIGQGGTAKLDASVACPKTSNTGESVTWTVSGTLGFAQIGRDDTFASPDAMTVKCTGKFQKVKIPITAYYNPPIPRNCSAEYFLTFDFSDGAQVNVQRGATGPANGPEICLT